nr:hypothetical protein DXGOKGYL_DXGOKGYL_CDS_0006 [Microvirus sp.]
MSLLCFPSIKSSTCSKASTKSLKCLTNCITL